MLRLFRLVSLMIILALALPVPAADEKKDDKDKKGDDKKDAKDKKKKDAGEPKPKPEKLVYGAQFVGKLTQLAGNSQQEFTVQLTIKYLEPDPQAQANLLRQQQQVLQKQRQIMLTRNPLQRQQLLVQLLQQIQQGQQQK